MLKMASEMRTGGGLGVVYQIRGAATKRFAPEFSRKITVSGIFFSEIHRVNFKEGKKEP